MSKPQNPIAAFQDYWIDAAQRWIPSLDVLRQRGNDHFEHAATKPRHPCYFVGFLPEPMPGQTVEDVFRAEAVFIETVARRRPQAEGKPMVIANCQAGWQIMMMATLNPDLAEPIMLAGSPKSSNCSPPPRRERPDR